MQGLFIWHDIGDDHDMWQRPRSKKEVRETIAHNPKLVHIEATSVFGNEFEGNALDMPVGSIAFVGPDPYRKRNFYGTITRTAADKWSVK